MDRKDPQLGALDVHELVKAYGGQLAGRIGGRLGHKVCRNMRGAGIDADEGGIGTAFGEEMAGEELDEAYVRLKGGPPVVFVGAP